MRGDIGDIKNQTAARNLAIARLEGVGGSTGRRGTAEEGVPTGRGAEVAKRHDEHQPSRFHSLEFPTFNGKEDLLPWLIAVSNPSEDNGRWRKKRSGSSHTISWEEPNNGISGLGETTTFQHGRNSSSMSTWFRPSYPKQPPRRACATLQD